MKSPVPRAADASRKGNCRIQQEIAKFPIATIPGLDRGFCVPLPSPLGVCLSPFPIRRMYASRTIRAPARDFISRLRRLDTSTGLMKAPPIPFTELSSLLRERLRSFISALRTRRDHGRQDWKILFTEISRAGRRSPGVAFARSIAWRIGVFFDKVAEVRRLLRHIRARQSDSTIPSSALYSIIIIIIEQITIETERNVQGTFRITVINIDRTNLI